jgi:F-type H+-transporting ATPase subunit b
MNVILEKIGELVLGSLPTVVLFILLVLAYGILVRRPLDKILAERRSRTSGAVEQARGAIAAAEAETSVYDKKLKQWNADRDSVLDDVRKTTQERIKIARQEIEQSAAAARSQIEGMSAELTAQILKAVLPAGVVLPEVTQ